MAQLSSPEKSPFAGRRLLFVGVAAAATMGVGLGLWARPAMSERQLVQAPAETPAPATGRSLQIVVDNTPAPLGKPIEVLPASGERPRAMPPPERLPLEPMAPVRPASGLVRVQSIEPQPVESAPPKILQKAAPTPAVVRAVTAPKPVLRARPVLQPVKAPVAKAKPGRIEKVKVAAKAKPKPQKLEAAKVIARPQKATVRLTKLERPVKPVRVEKVQLSKPAKPGKPSSLVHAVARAAPHKAEPPAKVQKARVERKAVRAVRPRVEKVAVKAPPAKVAAPVRPPKPVRGSGPVRYAKADPRPELAIRDADRQMNRAYSSARAAGVPDWQLRKQQARWEAARASAAREAPWAVHDVYLARIAELHDLTRDAEGPGY